MSTIRVFLNGNFVFDWTGSETEFEKYDRKALGYYSAEEEVILQITWEAVKRLAESGTLGSNPDFDDKWAVLHFLIADDESSLADVTKQDWNFYIEGNASNPRAVEIEGGPAKHSRSLN